MAYSVKDFLDWIPGSGGIISTIAKRAQCDWRTANKYINEHPTLKAAYDAECETMLDLAESTVLKAIKDGDTADAKWYLTKKGKRRGYGDTMELTGEGGGPIKTENKTTLDLSRLTDDELRTLRTLRAKANPDAPADAG